MGGGDDKPAGQFEKKFASPGGPPFLRNQEWEGGNDNMGYRQGIDSGNGKFMPGRPSVPFAGKTRTDAIRTFPPGATNIVM